MQRRRCPSPIPPLPLPSLLLDLFETFQIRPANVSNAGRAWTYRDVPGQFLSSSALPLWNTPRNVSSNSHLVLLPLYQSLSMQSSSIEGETGDRAGIRRPDQSLGQGIASRVEVLRPRLSIVREFAWKDSQPFLANFTVTYWFYLCSFDVVFSVY